MRNEYYTRTLFLSFIPCSIADDRKSLTQLMEYVFFDITNGMYALGNICRFNSFLINCHSNHICALFCLYR